MANTPRHLVVGQIQSAFGLRGEVKIKVHSDAPERFSSGAVVYLREGGELIPLTVISSRPHKQSLLVRFEGYADRSTAETLHGQMLVIPTDQASPLEEDEFYPHEVTGSRVITTEGEDLGAIVEVLFTGANEVLVVQGENGDLLIPVLKNVVLEINRSDGSVLVDLPPGLR